MTLVKDESCSARPKNERRSVRDFGVGNSLRARSREGSGRCPAADTKNPPNFNSGTPRITFLRPSLMPLVRHCSKTAAEWTRHSEREDPQMSRSSMILDRRQRTGANNVSISRLKWSPAPTSPMVARQ